jgi:hypothetical protein
MDPTSLIRLSTAYWESQVLLTANRMGVFRTLAATSLALPEIATALGTHPHPTAFLLKACVALGLLEVAGDRYRNSALSTTFLVPSSPAYMGNAIRYSDDLYDIWGQLERALRDNRPVIPPATHLGDDPEKTRHFVFGMHNRALGIGQALVGLVNLDGCQRLLDVGGGPGTYSALLTRRYPGLHAQVLDLPQVVAIATEIMASMAATDCVTTLAGDYHTTPWPGSQDAVLISGVLHRETTTTCRDLITRARDCLTAGGQLIVADVLTDAGGVSPTFATLFGLNMLLTTQDGGVHADADVADWMRQASFTSVAIRPFPPPMPHRVVVGVKA